MILYLYQDQLISERCDNILLYIIHNVMPIIDVHPTTNCMQTIMYYPQC